MITRRAWLLVMLEAVALGIFFYCAQKAKDLYIEIAAIEFNVGNDLTLGFIKWHTNAREAFWTLGALWLIAITLAVSEHASSGKVLSELRAYRPSGVMAFALGLPLAGLLAGFVFDLLIL